MTTRPPSLYSTYDREPCGGLYCLATGQRLLIRKRRSTNIDCEYLDSEIGLRFSVRLLDKGNYYGKVALVDWNDRTARSVRESYGAWRRITWFLLDAILVWLIEEKRDQHTVLILGGWLNGEWQTKGRFTSSWYDGGTHRDRLAEEVHPYAPFPLDRPAPKWRFERGLAGAREGRISCKDEDERFDFADIRVPVAEQLSEVPRFLADDGTILFFHRVVPHSGPEYSPSMQYGLATLDYAFYFNTTGGTLTGKPMKLRDNAVPAQALIRAERSRHWPERFGPQPDSWRLHPDLREQQYFAGAEAYALSFGTPLEQFPEMRSIEHDQPKHFGPSLGEISSAPMSVGLPSTHLGSLPRLSTETDERARGFFAKIREARRARGEREFRAFQTRLLAGQVPEKEINDLLARYEKRRGR